MSADDWFARLASAHTAVADVVAERPAELTDELHADLERAAGIIAFVCWRVAQEARDIEDEPIDVVDLTAADLDEILDLEELADAAGS